MLVIYDGTTFIKFATDFVWPRQCLWFSWPFCQLNSQFKKNAGAYVKNGGSKDYILSKYRNLTPVQQYLLRQDQKKVEEAQSKQKDPYAALKGL